MDAKLDELIVPAGRPARLRDTVRVAVRYSLVVVRLYFGAWMFLNGLNHFLPIFPQPMGGTLRSSQLMVTLVETGLFDIVKGAEIVVGVLLLVDCFVPLALVMALPISVVVWYNHAVLNGKPWDVSMGIGCLLWNSVLLLAYFRYYVPMLRAGATLGAVTDIKHWVDVAAQDPVVHAPESKHRVAILVVGLVITMLVGYRLHPTSEQPAGSGQTPARIVSDYRQLAYVQGNKREADAKYLSPQWASRESSSVLNDVAPLELRDAEVIGQGSDVAVLSRSTGSDDRQIEIVDIYHVAHSLIVEHIRVAQPEARPSGDAAAILK